MNHGNREYRQLLAGLDEVGINIHINRVGPKRFELIQNFEVKRVYKIRRSINKYIKRLYAEKVTNKLITQ